MLDLSNNNGPVNFETVHAHGQRRVYLKRSEGTHFIDKTFPNLYARARHAGMIPGAYHFARPSQNTPSEEAQFFLRLLPQLEPGKTLRPCLDLEDPDVTPSAETGKWAVEWLRRVNDNLPFRERAILYGSPFYMEACQFRRVPTGLWLAAYGRNDGKEHPFHIPAPWSHSWRARQRVLAHQYASTARVPGCSGQVDISHVFRPHWLTVHRLHGRH